MIYALTQRSPSGRMLSRYIGSTAVTAELRVKWHVRTVSQVERWNADLAKLLRSGYPAFKILAEVPDEERFEAEAEITRQYRKHHRIVNVKDGTRHTAESLRRIRLGKQKASQTPLDRPVRAD